MSRIRPGYVNQQVNRTTSKRVREHLLAKANCTDGCLRGIYAGVHRPVETQLMLQVSAQIGDALWEVI
jgi:hypothetical protein